MLHILNRNKHVKKYSHLEKIAIFVIMTTTNYILSLESSDNTCGVALSKNGVLLGEINYYGKNMHDRLLAETSKKLLTDFGIAFSNLSAVAVSAGPGSFTGLRISAALAKGICFDKQIKFIAVPNSEAYAFAALDFAKIQNAKTIVTAIKSHGDYVYVQSIDVATLQSDEFKLIKTEDLISFPKDGVLFVGSASPLLEKPYYLDEFVVPKASYISSLANRMYAQNEFEDASQYEPTYIQEFIPKTSTKELSI